VQGAPLAEAFNDQAVSENVSISKSLKMMKKNKNMDFLCRWKKAAKAEFRRAVIDVVLATEMTRCAALMRYQSFEALSNVFFLAVRRLCRLCPFAAPIRDDNWTSCLSVWSCFAQALRHPRAV
jgi:hypothetical protein